MPRQLLGTAIAANTITTTQLQTTIVNNITQGGGPRVTSLIYPGNDTAANTVGGQTVYINGSGFETNNAIYINGNAVPSKSFISASNLSFTTPALSAGIYPVYVINTDTGATAIFVPGYISSAEPTWVTSAGSLSSSQEEGSAWNYSLSATGDAPITYALAAGSSLPGGISLAANGLISGTISSPTGNATTYTFSVVATDAQNQDSTRQFTVTTSTGEGVLFANNVLLIHADGTNNGNNHAFVDSSNNNFTITRNGNPTQGSFSPFSQTGWSAYFDGTGDYLSFGASGNTAYDIISGNFTVECWIYDQGSGAERYIFSNRGASSGWELRKNSTNLLQFFFTGGSSLTSTSTITSNKWTHVAVTRNGNTVRIFIDGVLDASSTFADGSSGVASSLYIGYGTTGGGYFLGNISNARIIKGNALYTATFTPPTSALTAVANTQLLTCQSNRFIDNSTNAFTITRNGDTSIQAWSPFAPTAAYSTSTVGGSGYFDGTGDGVYFNYGSTTHSFWNNDFTLEFWVKTTSTASPQAVFSSWADSGFGSGSYFFSIDAGVPKLYHRQSSGTDQAAFTGAGSTIVNDNAWHHVVITQATGAQKTFRVFVDGVLRGYKQETNWTQSTSASNIYVAEQGPGTFGEASRYFTGHLSGFRLSNTVVAAYSTASTTTGTSVFSVPTAPPTNTANTVALLNFTNAQIFDQTAKNIIETVGDAKVSTAQYKYGTGSIAFDGTGDYLTIAANPLLAFGTGDFTVEFWFRSTDGDGNLIGITTNAAGNWNLVLASSSLYWQSQYAQTNLYNRSATGILDGNWHHIAITRASGTSRMFFDGTQQGVSVSDSTSYAAAHAMQIGSSGVYGDIAANIDDLRITKGYARYTSNFTAPSSAFKDK